MFRLRIEVDGVVEVDRVLRGIDARGSDLGPVWPAVVKVFQGIVAQAFATEGASTGEPWPQLAPRTQADRRRLGFPPAHPILERTGALLRALTIGEGAFISMAPRRLSYVLSDTVGYFKYHQSNKPRTRLPRRAPVQFTADQRTALMHPVRLYLTGYDVDAPRRAAIV